MLGVFKRKKKKLLPELVDIENNLIREGDKVELLRYEMGVCELILVQDTFYYQSLTNDKRIIWLKMIDASTDRQKVRIIND